MEEDMKKLLVLLEEGKQTEFLNIWQSVIYQKYKNNSEFNHLTFYSYVYFLVKNIKRSQKDPDSQKIHRDEDPLQLFKDYLWENGTYFSCKTEFIPYFVLPFTEEPQKNIMFTELFQERWETDTKEKIESFLMKNCNSKSPKKSENVQRKKSHSRDNSNYWKMEYNYLRKKFDDLYEDTELSMGISTELLNALEKFVSGEEIDLKLTLNKCNKMKFSLINKNSLKMNLQLHDEYKCVLKNHKQCDNSDSFSVRNLDIEKVKADLLNGSAKTKLLILQALRWGITKSNSIESHYLIWLISEYDILHLMTEDKNFVKDMLLPANVNTPHPTQQSIARLMSVVATFRLGQNYLASNEITELLIGALRHADFVEIDEITINMLILILQTFSWIRYLGEQMIKQNIIEWIIKYVLTLTEWNSALKNSLLLLMSLTRHQSAKIICIELQNDILQFIRNFLSGKYKYTENCESIFWRYCAFLESILTKPNPTIDDWNCISYKFNSNNMEIICKYFSRLGVKEEVNCWELDIDADDPLKAEPNGMEFLRLNYSSIYE